ncbi:hypothetical protein GLYMA_19G262000v4 [Glycine max]|uniref:uncharacterized protein isoform X1 n=1 Tax=Glycine max TaxID=3847 RepID=UPI0007193517|nr:uncharacterized protein LOC100812708 isoform X1 [Glycine max]KAG4396743.1 hypothetical protein GLYMA_19G262000v4 [Glycine max]KAH1079675.1 hypothetical protein GYH30_054288 [Glycine max]|eukprot:XP_014627417.1 uncharacterized protein LOC100812708 isoform X1 [Glycine max]
MPLLEITNAQLSFRYSLTIPMPHHHAKGGGSWISFRSLRIRNLNVIKAVATLDAKPRLDLDAPHPPGFLLEFSDPPDDREKLRRLRISKANKGNTPWNKGRKHTPGTFYSFLFFSFLLIFIFSLSMSPPETLQKIKERTRLAMQNPKVKMKLINLGHAQTTETRKKIGVGVRRRWEKRRGKKMVQESCCTEWQNLIAEASRQGYVGQEELQWNSYETVNEQLKQDWLMSVEQRKQMARTPSSKRAPKSPEQRRKIAEAIAAKWADPEYRERVCSALAKYHGSEVRAERKPRRRPSDGTQPTKKKPAKKRDIDTSAHVKNDSKTRKPILLKKSKSPAYKDPLVNSKLEMIKNIRAQRVAAETTQTQAIEQARVLIAEAEKAAKALEVAATKSPIAQSSLIETRKLIAEAIQSLESIDTQAITEEKGSAFEVLNQSQMAQVNGHTMLSSSDYKFSEDFGKFSLEKPVNGDAELLLTNGCTSLPFSLNSQMNESSPSNQQREAEQDQRSEYETDPSPTVMGIHSLENQTMSVVTKKWVRGRLVEVAEEKQ